MKSSVEQPKDPQKELEIQLSELEERVDRLRALYEQYFMGFEKIEPAVQRKDVDRRFTNLRKIQIRNTALRFRFNVVTQKFNTYAMYWTRVCRQIEEGTFKRHIAKAQRRFAQDDANANAKSRRRELDEASIDVELGDFEDDVDMDRILAEADAAAASYDKGGSDTLPPGAPTEPPPRSALTTQTAPIEFKPLGVPLPPPSTSFVRKGGRESVGAPESRPMRAAALPPGAKPKVLVRRGDAPPSSTLDVSPPTLPESERLPASTSAVRSAPSTPMRARQPSQPDGVPAPQAYRPAQRPANIDAPSAGRLVARPATSPHVPTRDKPAIRPIATPPSPMTPRPVPSSNRMPVAQPFPAVRPTTGIMERHPLPSDGAAPDSEAPRTSRRPPPPLPSATAKKNQG